MVPTEIFCKVLVDAECTHDGSNNTLKNLNNGARRLCKEVCLMVKELMICLIFRLLLSLDVIFSIPFSVSGFLNDNFSKKKNTLKHQYISSICHLTDLSSKFLN
jgi:hypothetical protein